MNDAPPQDDWLQAARMEALEAEVRRLQSVEDALTASQAEIERLRIVCEETLAITENRQAGSYDDIMRLMRVALRKDMTL